MSDELDRDAIELNCLRAEVERWRDGAVSERDYLRAKLDRVEQERDDLRAQLAASERVRHAAVDVAAHSSPGALAAALACAEVPPPAAAPKQPRPSGSCGTQCGDPACGW